MELPLIGWTLEGEGRGADNIGEKTLHRCGIKEPNGDGLEERS